MLGRHIRHPLISFHNPELWYAAQPGTKPVRSTFIVQKYDRTVDCNGIPRLAHLDQVKAADSNEKLVDDLQDADDQQTEDEQQAILVDEVRRSGRQRQPLVALNDYVERACCVINYY